MSRLKGTLAGLGVAGLIVVSLILLMLVAGAATTFSGWGSGQGGGKSRDLVVRAAPTPDITVRAFDGAERPRARRQGGARTRQPPTRAGAKRPATDRDAGAVRQSPETSRPRPFVVRPRPRKDGRARPAPQRPAAVTQPAPEPVDPTPVRSRPQPAGPIPDLGGVPRDLADATEALTGGLGRAIKPASPTLGDTVGRVGETASDLVRALGPARR